MCDACSPLTVAACSSILATGCRSRPLMPTQSCARECRAVADSTIVIRPTRSGDDRALARLAGLDSASVPGAPLLLAEVGGELRAALSLHDGTVIADPFHRTVQLVSLLQTRAEQLLVDDRTGSRRWFGRPRSRLAPAR